jgi:DNA polymerase III delta subunit
MASGKNSTEERGGAWPRTLLVWASDVRFLEGASEAWCEAWAGSEAVLSLSASDVDPASFSMEVATVPMWSEYQVVRLRQGEEASDTLLAALTRYLEKPSPTTALLIEYTGDLDDRRLPAAWRKLKEQVECRGFTPRNAKDYVQRRIKAEGFTITPEALSALDEWALGDVARLVSALDLLVLYKFDEKTIKAEDLGSLLGAGGAPKQWDLQDAFLKGDRAGFVALLEGVRRDPEAVPLAFLGMVAKQLRALLIFRGHLARGRKRSEVSPKDLGFNHPFPAQKLLSIADRWPEGRIRAAMGALFDLDLALKGDPGEPWSIVERHLLGFLQAGQGSAV